MWSIQGLHNNFLEDSLKYDEKPSDWWRASDMGACLRKRFYQRKGIKKTEPFTVNTKRNLELGNMYHRYYQSFFKKLGILIEKEGEIVNEKYHYKGHFDVIAGGKPKEPNIEDFKYTDKNGEIKVLERLYNFCIKQKQELDKLFPKGMPKLLYEFKTQNGNSFQYISRAPQQEHLIQLASYLLFAKEKYPDIKEGRILYINKNNLTEVEHIIDLTPELETKIIDELIQLNTYWERDELPSQLPEVIGKQPNWQCQYCPFKTYCRGKGWEIELKRKLTKTIKI